MAKNEGLTVRISLGRKKGAVVMAETMAAISSAASLCKIVAEYVENRKRASKVESYARIFAQISPMIGTIIPVFDGRNYAIWSSKMKPLFITIGVWNIVEQGFVVDTKKKKRRNYDGARKMLDWILHCGNTWSFEDEDKAKDAMALLIIRLAVNDSVGRCILKANNSKHAWDTLQSKYQAADKSGKVPFYKNAYQKIRNVKKRITNKLRKD